MYSCRTLAATPLTKGHTTLKPDHLTGPELFRLIARMGGLWSMAEVRKVCGDSSWRWPAVKGFPEPAWKVGATKLYGGWEIWAWLEETKRINGANKMYVELKLMRKVKREDIIG